MPQQSSGTGSTSQDSVHSMNVLSPLPVDMEMVLRQEGSTAKMNSAFLVVYREPSSVEALQRIRGASGYQE